jgi:K+-transporting ATPase ATPase C chain
MKAFRMLLVMTLLTGVLYPLLITALAAGLWPNAAKGSPLNDATGTARGSTLLAQAFAESRYFWPRPSACGFATVASCAGNKGPTSRDLRQTVADREVAIRKSMAPSQTMALDTPIPRDLLYASGSGLDPHISPEAALLQIPRIASARGLPEQTLRKLLDRQIEGPQFGLFGEPRVNVLLLNASLDGFLMDTAAQKE